MEDVRPHEDEVVSPEAAPSSSAPADAEGTPVAASEEGTEPATSAATTESTSAAPQATPKKGARISGRIVQIGEAGVFVDFGGREEAVLDVREITDEAGAHTKAVGDTIQATVMSVDGGVKLSMKSKSRAGDLPALLEAAKTGLPVNGKVTGTNKGGLVVHVMGLRAFCPFSQIDRHYVEKPEEFVGKTLAFRVASSDDKGRNIVLSRRSLVEEEAKAGANELREKVQVGTVLEGRVVRIRPFGAFVDLGGIDGLIHVSEISHSRVKDPGQVLAVGQTVKVEVVKVEDLGGPSERISLSRKKFAPDPWTEVADEIVPGTRVTGKIVRIVEFGAFVELRPGVDGLIHVSALADGHVNHPSSIVSVGDEVQAWVLAVNRENRRISLSLLDPSAQRPEPTERSPRTPDYGDMPDYGGGGGGGGGRGDRGERDRGERRSRKGRREGRDSRDSWEMREYRESNRGADTGMTSMEEAFQRLRKKN